MSNIRWLNVYIKERLKGKGVSIKMLCDKAGLNYNKILKIIKGDILCGPAELNAFLSSGYFTKDEKIKIERAYQYTNLELEEKIQIIEIENILRDLYETLTEHATLKESLLEAKGQDSEVSKLSLKVNDQFYKSYTATLKKVFIEGSGSFEMILYLPDEPALINDIYYTIKALKACLDKRITLKIDCVIEGCVPYEMTQINQYKNYLKYIKMATLSEEITIKVLKYNELDLQTGLYFKDRTILIDEKNLDVTVLYKNMMSSFDEAIWVASPLIESNFTIRKSTDDTCYQGCIHKKSNHYKLINNIDPLFVGEETLKNYGDKIDLKTEGLSRDNVADETVFFISENGLELLLSEGKISDYSGIFSPVDGISRLALVYDTLDKMRRGYHIRLLPKKVQKIYPYLGIVQYFEIYKSKESLVFRGQKKSGEYFTAHTNPLKEENHEFIIRDKLVISAFELFCKKTLYYISDEHVETFEKIKAMALKQYINNSCEKIRGIIDNIEALELT